MPKVTIDGEEIEVAAGATILQAALARGREIPHYCYHPGLSVSGNCRMCLVEVEKSPKLLIGCYTPVPLSPGHNVDATDEFITEMPRRMVRASNRQKTT